ncbi:hypothetical protein BH11ARM1_BH11ARM1_12460 [soil metagenome]
MVTCPKCSASLPDWTQTCQFCQTDVRLLPRGVTAKKNIQYYEPAKWVKVAYNLISLYFVLSGALNVVATINSTHEKFMGEEIGFTFGTYIAIAVSAVTILVGIGLLLKVEVARGIVNFICGMRIIFGLATGGITVITALAIGPFGVLLILLKAFDIITAGLMLYVIGETDTAASL